MNYEFIKYQTEQLINDFENIYKQIYKSYEAQLDPISANKEKNIFFKNTTDYLLERHKNYLIFAKEVSVELEDKLIIAEIEKSFKKIYKIFAILLKKQIRIAKKSFFSVNRGSRKIILEGIKEEHLLYLEKIKIFENKLKKEAIR